MHESFLAMAHANERQVIRHQPLQSEVLSNGIEDNVEFASR
jgi:hypothetical protein